MSRIELRVLERHPYHLPELQRQLSETDFEISGVHDFASLAQQQPLVSPRLVVVDLEFDPAGCIHWLQRRLCLGDETAVIVTASAEAVHYEWTLRSLRVHAFRTVPIAGVELARLCRSFARVAAAPRP